MKRRGWPVRAACAALSLLLCAGLAAPALAAGGEESVLQLTGQFDSPSCPDRELTAQFPYSDDWFTGTGELYNHQLAQCTLGMAVSAFRSADQPLDHKDAHIRDYLTQAGFGEFVSQQFDETPTAETIATLIGSKRLRDEQGEFLLVAAAVSGGGYEDEWLSNFSFGDSAVHDGFFTAASEVFRRVFDYVDAYADGGRFKLWMGGYSRAAAVSNMAAVLAIETEKVANEDLYVYTFATPNNAQTGVYDFSEDGTYDLSNIFNIVGMFDPVPTVPIAEWGYGKLGTTLHLPAQETTPDYLSRREPVAEIYRDITGREYTNSLEVNWLIQKLCQLIYDMAGTAGEYQTRIEAVLDKAWENRSGTLQLLKALCGALTENGDTGQAVLDEAPTANTLLSVLLWDLLQEKLEPQAEGEDALKLSVRLFYEHCPEVYVSWMLSQDDPEELFVFDLDYRRVFLDSGVTWSLRDEDGEPVDVAGVGSLGGVTMLTVPADRTYVLTLSEIPQGAGQVRAVEYSAGSLHYAYKIFDLDGTDGDVYELLLPDEFWSGETLGAMTGADGEAVLPTVQALEREEVHPSAVFELAGCGFWASHFIELALGAIVLLVILVVVLLIVAVRLLLRRRKRRRLAPGAE